jgi:purine-nucleoside phosphorylase
MQLAGKRVEFPVAQVVSHDEVLSIGKEKGNVMTRLVERIVELIPMAV